jgi:hypothetical protein
MIPIVAIVFIGLFFVITLLWMSGGRRHRR